MTIRKAPPPAVAHGAVIQPPSAGEPAQYLPLPPVAPGVLARRMRAITGAPPQTRLDWALYWARKGMSVFPAEDFLGTPIEPKWYRAASSDRDAVVAWWAATPAADIGVVPERSGHYVIVARGRRGRSSLFELEDECGGLQPEFYYQTRWGDLHVWLKGEACSSQDALAPGLDVIGPGRFLFLPPSSAPDPLS